ncbi:MAG: polysaccharide deacetylase family protein [Clostridia bacterium]|nr:polysaccharide deacetylase family protein [Clostridia bacterium]
MLRFSYKCLALSLAALLFCTGCQLKMGYPEELQTTPADTILKTDESGTTTTKAPDSKPADPTDGTTPGTTTDKQPDKPGTDKPVTDTPTTTQPTPDAPPTEEPTVPKKRVAFTFDDGPHNTLTYQFVDKLKEYGASATFFVVGNRLGKSGGAAIAYAYENGCEIGLHSYTHDSALYYDRCTEEEYFSDMQQTVDAIHKYVDTEITLMRPTGGNISKERIPICPYSVILWSVDSNDWRYKARTDEATIEANINTIVNNVMSQIKDGDIVLMHEIYQNSYEAFCIIIEQLYADGYEIVSVTELLGDRLEPGQKYNHA